MIIMLALLIYGDLPNMIRSLIKSLKQLKK
jgi:hypothetical protein